jgi:3-deoxy-manno-octulosonate cytidylyltransferase (CMP-KDO synthetase)
MIESCIIIPSRIGSGRFPGKPLATIAGKKMITRVLEAALNSSADSVIVATDDERIYDVCEGYATMTGECPNGTARVIEVAKRIKAKVYVNLQGDEPLVSPHDLNKLILKCHQMPGVHTLMTAIEPDDMSNMNAVKVFCDVENECWLFTRNAEQATSVLSFKFYKHIGIYAFDRETLLKLEQLEPTPNAIRESLEQLTWLDHEIPIYAWNTNHKYQAVDTIEDIQKVIDILHEDSLHHPNL